MRADAFLRKAHRVIAAAFLLTIPPAAYASIWGGGEPAIFVYAPLLPLFALIITGTYLLVRPWVRKWRGRTADESA